MMTVFMILAIAVVMMTDVSSRSHGGDGDDGGRRPDERPFSIASQCEAPTKKKGRGENANQKLERLFKQNGMRPLPISYLKHKDSYRIVGTYQSLYTRKLSSEVKLRADFHYDTWAKVPDSVKAAIYKTLQHYFDFGSIQSSFDWVKVKKRLDWECANRYSDIKHKMKVWFDSNGGVENLAHARTLPYKKIKIDKWQLITDNLWANPKRIQQAQSNSQNRAKHRYQSTQGSSSFAQQLFDSSSEETTQAGKAGPLEIWYRNHVLKNPNNPLALADWAKLQEMKKTMEENEAREDGSIDELECISRVLPTRRGFQTGIGPTLGYTYPDMGSSSSHEPQNIEDVEARIDARVSQQVSQQLNVFMDQMRAMNPGFNFPQLPNQNNNEDGDGASS